VLVLDCGEAAIGRGLRLADRTGANRGTPLLRLSRPGRHLMFSWLRQAGAGGMEPQAPACEKAILSPGPAPAHAPAVVADAPSTVTEFSRFAAVSRRLGVRDAALFASVATQRRCIAGETVFAKGEAGNSMFVVETGAIRIELGDGLPDRNLGPNDFFGELALFVANRARGARAVATEPTVLRVVGPDAFERLLREEPERLCRFMRQAFSYQVASEQDLIANLQRRNEALMVTLHSLQHMQSQLSTANDLVRTDELTGLTNRRGLYQFLTAVKGRRQADTRLALILVDLDDFKSINDRHGHQAGDAVLCRVAADVRALAAACDLPCRLGGDEFALLIHVAGIAELELRAARVVGAVQALRLPPPLDTLRVSVSVGASLCREGGDWTSWYSDADGVLYQAKREGGDRWRALR